MTREERVKLLRTAEATAALNPLVPVAFRLAIAALVAEVADLNARIVELERRQCPPK